MSSLVQLNNFSAIDADDVMAMVLDKKERLIRITMRDGNQHVRRISAADFAHYADPHRNRHRGSEAAPVMDETATMNMLFNRLFRAVNAARSERFVEKDFLPAMPRTETVLEDDNVTQRVIQPPALLTGDAAIRARLLAQGAVQ